ncbi:MAG: ADOP family duplicated permease [Paludibaculum sp.]
MENRQPEKSEVLQGTLILLVLRTLQALGPLHGYGIARRIEQISKDLLQLNQGTLYPALLRMEQEGWISSAWGASEKNRKARFYTITPAGRRRLEKENRRLAPHVFHHRSLPHLRPRGHRRRSRVSFFHTLPARLSALFRRTRLDRELDDELRFHLEMQIDDNVRAGMSSREARDAALRALGPLEPMKESYRDRRTFAALESVIQDLRYALRTLRRSPGYTLTALTVLALAIGANTAMFSILNSVLFRPLPYREPGQLAMLWSELPTQSLREGRTAFLNIEQWRAQSRTFTDMAFYDPATATITRSGQAEYIRLVLVSPNYFPLMGITPKIGRLFTAEEAAQRQRHAIISHSFWQSHFAGQPSAIGASVELDGQPTRIIGVLDPAFQLGNKDPDLWLPHTLSRDWDNQRAARGMGPWLVVGRLQPQASQAQAQAEMNTIAARLDRAWPSAAGSPGVSVVPLAQQLTGPRARLTLWMLASAVFLVLLIAATNVAGLSLARGTARARELSVRAALGASRFRLARQLLAESLALSSLAALLGLLLAHAAIGLVVAVQPAELVRLQEARLDLRAFACALVLCLSTGLLTGLAPAFTLTRRTQHPSARPGGRGIAGGFHARQLRRALVIAQFSFALILLTASGLLLRSLWSVQNVDLGFQSQRILSLSLAITPAASTAQRAAFYARVLDEVRALPSVQSAGIVSNLFIGAMPEQTITLERSTQSAVERLRFRSDEVSPGLFQTLGAPLMRGRFFTAADGPDAPRVAIVNDVMARRLWPGQDPIGARCKLGPVESPAPWITIVGVVATMRRQGLETEPGAQFFEPVAQNPSRLSNLIVRTALTDPRPLVPSVRAAVSAIDPQSPVYGVTTLEDNLDRYLAPRRFQAWLLIGFSAVALLIAAIGIYGLIQYATTARTHEIGIRLALGALPAEIFRMTIAEGLKLSCAGLAIGLLGAVWVTRAGASLLYGVSATDPATFLLVTLLLTAVAAVACYGPARRARRVDPVAALRQD